MSRWILCVKDQSETGSLSSQDIKYQPSFRSLSESLCNKCGSRSDKGSQIPHFPATESRNGLKLLCRSHVEAPHRTI